MSEHQMSIDVQVPVQTAYNQWTQFETFAQFMEGVEEVRQVTDTKLHWVAKFGGTRREWDAENRGLATGAWRGEVPRPDERN